jgi:hypothetical protein
VTLAGTVAAPLSLDKVTMNPPARAGRVSVIVPVEEEPPATEVGLRVTADRAGGGLTVRGAVTLTTPAEAVMVAV